MTVEATPDLLCGRMQGACLTACWRLTSFAEACPPRIHHPACPARETSTALDCIGCPR